MAIQYFVHAGIQFRTVKIQPSLLSLPEGSDVHVTVLEDVVDVLGTLLDASEQRRMAILRNYWTTAQSDIREVRRSLFVARAPIVGTAAIDVDDTGNPPTRYTIHKEATEWILPLGFEQNLALPTADSDAASRQLWSLVNAMVVNHVNIRKYPTAAAAWTAWRNYTLMDGLSETLATIRSNYLVNP